METLSRCKPLLGTYVTVHAADDDKIDLHDMVDAAFEEILRISKIMSFHDRDSELSYINREAYKRPCRISPEMTDILTHALHLSRLTDGLYDISVVPALVRRGILPDYGYDADKKASWRDIILNGDTISFLRPMALDLGGIAKGYAVDSAFSLISPYCADVAINAGGDLRMSSWEGKNANICIPGGKTSLYTDTPMQESALATSCAIPKNNRLSCTISPHTRKPVKATFHASVFAKRCMLADALTKIVFLMPTSTPILNIFGAKALLFDRHGNSCVAV